MKSEEKLKACELRRQGLAIKKIAEQLNVSKSTVSLWVRGIELSAEQIDNLKQQNPRFNSQLNGSKKQAEKFKLKRLAYQQAGKIKAGENNLLHMAGCMLYWAEGAKARTTCKFSNSDLNMLKFFLRFLKESYCVAIKDIRVHINCYTDNGISVQEIEQYWQQNLDLPSSCFTKTTTDVLSKWSQKKKSKNKLPYGTVTLSVSSVELLQNIYGAIQEFAGFNSNYCLD